MTVFWLQIISTIKKKHIPLFIREDIPERVSSFFFRNGMAVRTISPPIENTRVVHRKKLHFTNNKAIFKHVT
ncbi:hypothetical protein GCM10011364_10910 [Mangrovimonas yunxiaonensis]|nr:hypothetical protein GCM10011364_10910 [Mangrovimonas yunxiaonensis]